jgi:hypothetical protein
MASHENLLLLLANAREDPQFRALLRSEPRGALRGQGLTRDQVQLLLRAAALEADNELERHVPMRLAGAVAR